VVAHLGEGVVVHKVVVLSIPLTFAHFTGGVGDRYLDARVLLEQLTRDGGLARTRRR
jgi:hypothetical protein